MKSINAVCLGGLALLLLAGCPDTGIICQAGTVRCGPGCIDPTSDSKNCGSCGNACRSGQSCDMSSCKCSAGTVSCAGECSVLDTDPTNCGACGKICASGEFCDQGACAATCPLGSDAGCLPACPTTAPTRCGTACVDNQTNPNNCGSCGVVCENSQSCHAGHCTYDLVAACFSSGQLVGVQQSTEFKGPAESLGAAPAALAAYGRTLLVADGMNQELYQALLASAGGHAFAKQPVVNKTGNVPNQVLVDGTFVYVVNAGSGTLQVLKDFGAALPDGGAIGDGGVALATIAELPLGTNTYPEGMVKVGSALWIPLYGGFGAAGASAGQKVVKVDVTVPSAPVLVAADAIDLTSVNLKAFDGGTSTARPYAIATHQGSIYVVLSNLDADSYAPAGPGLLAKINPTTKAVTIVDLGADKCLNPLWLASDGTHLIVSCGGEAVYDGAPNFALISTEKSGVVLLDSNDVRQSSWTPSCPIAADGGAGCVPILPGRFALAQGRVYLGDQNAGRMFVLDINGNSLGERRGYFGDAGAAISACAVDPVTQIGNVSDVLVVP